MNHLYRYTVYFCLCAQMFCPLSVFAQAASHAVPSHSASYGQPSLNLDLSSTARTLQSNAVSPIDIKTGSSVLTVNRTDLLTAGEYVALNQILRTGRQFLQLDALGAASGGSFKIGANLMRRIDNLILPQGVSALVNFTDASTFNLSGNLSNAGSLYVFSSNANVSTATISAANIFNKPGGLITSSLPAALGASYAGARGPLNLVLNASREISNAGTITSSGSLSMSAAAIFNSLPQGSYGSTPVLQATNSVNLSSPNIVNAGLISSTLNNINITSVLQQDLVLANSGGALKAPAGTINIGNGPGSPFNLVISGGDFLSRELNLQTGGTVDLNARNVTGTVNVSACQAHVNAETNNLLLGVMNLSGDPTFFNTAGNVTLSSNMIFSGQELSIVASGDVTTSVPNLSIDTSSSSANGGDVLVVAGANVSSDGTNLQISTSGLPTGGSSTGGKIDFATNAIQALTTRSTQAGNGNGGNVTLIAYAGSGANSGTISLPTGNSLTLRTGGSNAGVNGSVNMIAGASSGSATTLSLGNVNTTSGANGTGNISLTTATPTLSNGPITVNIASGAMSGGSFTPGATSSGSIAANNLTAPGSNVVTTAGANASVGSYNDVGAFGTGSNGGSVSVTVNAVTDTGAAFVVGGSSPCTNCTPGGITSTAASGGTSGNGGTVNVTNAGTGGIKVTNPALVSVPVLTLSGNGGTINLNSGAGVLDLAGGTYAADAAGSGHGGSIVLNGASLNNSTNSAAWSFSAKGAVSGNGAGGLLSITTTGATGSIAFGSAAKQISSVTVQSGASGGNGGTVTLSAGQNLAVTAASITAKPQSTNGNGANFSFTAGTAAAGTLQITGGLSAGGSGTGSGGNVSLTYNDAGNPFVIGGAITASGVTGNINADAPAGGAGGIVTIRNSAAAPLNLALAGTLSANSTSGALGVINLNNGGNAVSVSGAGTLTGTIVAGGSSVAIASGSGNLVTGAITASNGALTLAANGGNLTLTDNLTASGSATLTSRAGNSITLSASKTLSASSISVTTGSLNLSGTLTATSGNLSVQSNSANGSLTVSMAGAGALNANGNGTSIFFNSATSGAITITGGSLSANSTISLNGGSSAVSTTSSSISGTVLASGSSVSISAGSGNLTVGQVTASAGDITLSTGSGNLTTGTVTASSGNATLTAAGGDLTAGATSASLAVTLSASGNLSAGPVTAAGASLQSSNGTLNSSSVNASGNVSMSSAGDLTAGPISAGSATLASGGTLTTAMLTSARNASFTSAGNLSAGAISAASVTLSSGGSLTATAAITVSGSVSLNSAGDLTAGTVSSSTGGVTMQSGGNLALTDNVTSAGGMLALSTGSTGTLSIAANKTASGNALAITSGKLNLNGTLAATAGDASIQSNAQDGSLTVSIASGATLSATGNVSFNQTGNGALVVTGGSGNGSLLAGSINLNGGNGAVTFTMNNASGTVSATGTVITVALGSGDLNTGSITASGNVSLSSAGNLNLNDNINISGGSLSASSSPTGAITQLMGKAITADSISFMSGLVTIGGAVTASVGNLALQSNRPDGTLGVAVNQSASMSATGSGSSISLNANSAGAITLSGGGSLSSSSAVTLNGGQGAVSVNIGSISGSLNASGSLVSLTTASGGLTVNSGLSVNGSFTMNTAQGDIAASNVTATNGSVSISGATTNISANGVSAANGTVTVTTTTGSINISNVTAAGAVSVSAGSGAITASNIQTTSGAVSLVTQAGGLTAGSLSTGSGSIALTSTAQLNITSGAHISATEGNVTLLNTDSAAGSITVGNGATISATTAGTVAGRVYIAIGSVPSTPAQGTAPGNLNVNLTNGGTVLWGNNGITADAPSGTINVDGGQVVFSTGTLNASAIHLNSQVTISSHAINPAPPPPPLLITSLDFTNPQTVSLLVSLQQQGVVGGSLKVKDGVAVGGNAIIDSSLLSPTITAENLPVHVTLTLKDFQISNPINISLSNSSTTEQVVIDGTEQFIGTANHSNAVINISQAPLENAFVIGKGGQLFSDGALSVSVAGNIAMHGTVNSSSVLLQTTAGNGNIALHGNITATSSVALSAQGAGNISWQSGLITAPAVSFTSGTGDIGNKGARIHTAAQTLSAYTSGSGNVYLDQTGPVTLLTSAAGNHFRLRASGTITVDGVVSSDDLLLRSTSSTGGISLAANLNVMDYAKLITDGSGSISQLAGSISADSIELRSASGAIGSVANPIQLSSSTLLAETGGSADVFLSATGSVSLRDSSAGGQFSLTATGGIETRDITTGYGSITLVAGSGALSILANSELFADEGNITLQDNNTTSGSIGVGRNSIVWAYTKSNPLLGNVALSIGQVPPHPVVGTKPSKLTVVKTDGGQVYFGTNSIATAKSGDTVLAQGRNVIFNTGSRPAAAIQLDANVTIIADPPAISPAAVTVVPAAQALTSTFTQPANYQAASAPFRMPNVNIGNSIDTSPPPAGYPRSSFGTGIPVALPGNRADADYEPISYVRSAPTEQLAAAVPPGKGLWIRHNGTVRLIESDGDVIRLQHGESLLAATHPAVVNLGNCNVSIAKGTIALLSSYSSVHTIRNLYESSPRSLTVALPDKSSVALAAGQELILASSLNEITDAFRNDGIGRRRTQVVTSDGGFVLARSEISLTSLLQANTLLHALCRGDIQDRAISSKLFKMAACLMISTPAHGSYTSLDK